MLTNELFTMCFKANAAESTPEKTCPLILQLAEVKCEALPAPAYSDIGTEVGSETCQTALGASYVTFLILF